MLCAQPQCSEVSGKILKTAPLHKLGLLPCSLAAAAIALRIDDVSVHVCPHLPFIPLFQTIENGYLKSLEIEIESQFRFVCPHFGSIKLTYIKLTRN